MAEEKRQRFIVFGCFDDKCRASEEYPIKLGGAGTEVVICALNMQVEIDFGGNTPFIDPNSNHLKIAAGSCVKEIVKAPNGTDVFFNLTCGDGKHCKTPNVGPEMIVP